MVLFIQYWSRLLCTVAFEVYLRFWIISITGHTHTKSHAHVHSFSISMNEIWELAHYDVTFLELELEFLEIPSATISYSGFNTE